MCSTSRGWNRVDPARTGERPRSGPAQLRIVRVVQRPGRQRLAAAGDHDAAARTDDSAHELRFGKRSRRARFGVRRPPTASTRSAPERTTRTGPTGTPPTWWRSRRDGAADMSASTTAMPSSPSGTTTLRSGNACGARVASSLSACSSSRPPSIGTQPHGRRVGRHPRRVLQRRSHPDPDRASSLRPQPPQPAVVHDGGQDHPGGCRAGRLGRGGNCCQRGVRSAVPHGHHGFVQIGEMGATLMEAWRSWGALWVQTLIYGPAAA